MRRVSTAAVGLVVLALAGGAASAEAVVPVYVTNFDSNSVSVFSIGSGGALNPVTCKTGCATGTGRSVAIDPSGRYVYVGDKPDGRVAVFSIGSSGALTPVTCTGCATEDPEAVAVDPSGRYVYVANEGVDTVSVYSIGPGGALTPVKCTGCATGHSPAGVAVDPSGRYVYVANGGQDSMSVFSIGPGGALTPVTCPGCTIDTPPPGGGSTPQGVVVDPSGRYVYVPDSSWDSVSVFKIGSGGALTPVTCTTGCATGTYPWGIAVDPSGRYVYTTNFESNSVSVFRIGTGGALTRVTCTTGCATGANPIRVAADPSGRYVYVTNADSDSVSAFKIGKSGALTRVTCTTGCATGTGPGAVAVDPDRGPTAGFAVTRALVGSASRFDASSSTSPEYPIKAYRWSFGDGHTATGSSPRTTHSYAKPGTYTVTLMVTDEAGCSTRIIYTGQTAYCDGSRKAIRSYKITIPATPVVYAGYADGIRKRKVSAPSPWQGSAGVIFEGCNYFNADRCPKTKSGIDRYDAGAIRIDNTTGKKLNVTKARVVIGACTFDPWPGLKITLPAGRQLILTQTGGRAPCHAGGGKLNFDTSETTHSCTHNDHLIPVVHVSIDGAVASFSDRSRILNTGGVDRGAKACGSHDETHAWGKMTPPT